MWKDIAGYEGMYQISNYGNVRSLDRITYNKNGSKINRVGKPKAKTIDNLGYYHVRLSKDSKTDTFRIHRLVAEAFIENPNGYKYINHKNEDKLDNSVDNLEWCSAKYNLEYSNNTRKAANSNKKPILQYSLDSQLIKEWSSMKEIEIHLGFLHGNIGKCCRGESKQSYGYIWRYKEQ